MKVHELLKLLDHVDLDAVVEIYDPNTDRLQEVTGIIHGKDILHFQCDIDEEEE